MEIPNPKSQVQRNPKHRLQTRIRRDCLGSVIWSFRVDSWIWDLGFLP